MTTKDSQKTDETKRSEGLPEPPAELSLRDLLDLQKRNFQAHPFPDAHERIANLDKLCVAVLARKEEFVQALSADFGGRSRHESLITDIFMVVSAIKHAKKEVKSWMKSQKRDVPITLGTGKAWVMPQPLGVIGIVSPWNFPLNLALCPLAAALAAGNQCMIKPSEFTPATSALLKKMIADTFAPEHVSVVTGDASVGKEFVSLPFDHLLFTGSTEVGKIVMKACAENLTPVTLELGGKSPAIVASDADLNEAATDIAFGKVLNAGQICIAPDYALVPRDKLTPFVEALQSAVGKYYPQGADSADYTCVANAKQQKRLSAYIDEARDRGAQVVSLTGEPTASKSGKQKMAPLAIVDPPEDLKIMHEEIFGPILLIKAYDKLDDAIQYVNDRPRPLALYLFTKSSRVMKQVLTRTISGGVSINDTIMHNAVDDLPFGGVGASGFGHYHGREGFNTFSKMKPVFERNGPRTDRFLRPPFKQIHDFLLSILLRP